jgi:hypothetical protein
MAPDLTCSRSNVHIRALPGFLQDRSEVNGSDDHFLSLLSAISGALALVDRPIRWLTPCRFEPTKLA